MTTLNLPAYKETGWHTKLNAALTALNDGKVEVSDFSAYQNQVSTSLGARAIKADVDASLNARVLTSTYGAFLTQNAADLNGKVSTTTFTAYQAQVTTSLNGKSDTGHVHSAADVTTGVFVAARLGVGSDNQLPYRNSSGGLSPITMSGLPNGNTLALRDSSGRVNTATPVSAINAANKEYVDSVDAQLSARIDGLGNSTPIRMWNTTTRTYPGIGGATDPLIFMSTNDKTAVAPADMRVDFDVWIPHVDAANA